MKIQKAFDIRSFIKSKLDLKQLLPRLLNKNRLWLLSHSQKRELNTSKLNVVDDVQALCEYANCQNINNLDRILINDLFTE